MKTLAFQARLQHRIVLLLVSVLTVSLGLIFWFLSSKMHDDLIHHEVEKTALLAAAVHQTLDKDMVAFRADIVRHLINDLQELNGIERMQVIRGRDGLGVEQAFQDRKTLDEVGTRVPLRPEWLEDHPNRSMNRASGVDHPEYRKAFDKIMEDPFAARDYYYFETIDQKPVLTYLRPLPNFQRCYLCHGSDHRLRGVLMISTSLEGTFREVAGSRRQLLIGALATVGCVGLLLGVAVQRVVVRPMRRVAERINSISEGDGDLATRIEVKTEDEIGLLASGFNRFADKITAIIGEVIRTSSYVSQAARGVLTNTSTITQDAELQANSMEEGTESVGRMTDGVSHINSRLSSLSGVASESGAAAMQMATTIDEIAREAGVLAESVENTTQTIETVSSSIQEIHRASEELDRQAAEASEALRQMQKSVQYVRERGQKTLHLSQRVSGDADVGRQAVDLAVEAVGRVREYSEQVFDLLRRLQTKTESIGKILDVIDEVAEQTNLLALNAAIIAAQAGDHGKGFAVVANEIKGLADRAASSTKEIYEIIRALKTEGDTAGEVIRGGTQRIDECVEVAKGAAGSLAKIRESVSASLEDVQGIVSSIEEQAGAYDMLTRLMQGVGEMIRQVTGSTQAQSRGSIVILQATERMREVARRVKSAIGEQVKGNRQIQQAIEKLNVEIREIAETSRQQETQGESIRKTIANIRAVTQRNIDAAGRVGYAAENLLRLTSALCEELGRFNIRGGESVRSDPTEAAPGGNHG